MVDLNDTLEIFVSIARKEKSRTELSRFFSFSNWLYKVLLLNVKHFIWTLFDVWMLKNQDSLCWRYYSANQKKQW